MAKIVVNIGEKYNSLTVIENMGHNAKHEAIYKCRCDCGREKIIRKKDFARGYTKSCGECKRNKKDIEIGSKFNNLTVIEANHRNKYGRPAYLCKCTCGNETLATKSQLTSGMKKSCGCLIPKTGMKNLGIEEKEYYHSKTKLYKVYHGMKQRCNNQNVKAYKNYGARGIKLCDEWENDYKTFEIWALSHGYNEGLTIERKDVNKGYCPDNCCWITKKEQGYNKRNTRKITYNGKSQCMNKWAEELNISVNTLSTRCYKGWSDKEIIEGRKRQVVKNDKLGKMGRR